MKKNKIYKCVVIILFMLLISFRISPDVHASEERPCRINIDCGYQDMQWFLYRIGTAEMDGSIGYDEAFINNDLSEGPVSYDQIENMTNALENYIKINKSEPEQSKTSDTSGHLSFAVKEGWYIAIPEKLITDKKVYTSAPVIVCVSNFEIYSEMWGEEVTVYPKTYESSEEQFEITITVTDSVYKDSIFSEDLPQTGQLWWPVPLLALSGMILFSTGYIMKKRRSDNEE